MDEAKDIEAALLSMADDKQARQLMRFFKTGKGEYGEGDRFLGLRNPQVRLVVKEAWKTTSLTEAARLAVNQFHEVRLTGLLIMVEHYLRAMKKKDAQTMEEIFNLYTSLHPYINNWDLVDLSAIKIVGNHESLHPGCPIMDEWILPQGHSLWQQRIAMVSTWILTRHDHPEICLKRARHLLSSPHNLLHKAAGWMLRECWKKGYKDKVRSFLEDNVRNMPSVMLSYTCEQMPIQERHSWQAKRRIISSSSSISLDREPV